MIRIVIPADNGGGGGCREVWPEHTGEVPDVSNLGNERETSGPSAADLRRLGDDKE